jgi:hypothetical protein
MRHDVFVGNDESWDKYREQQGQVIESTRCRLTLSNKARIDHITPENWHKDSLLGTKINNIIIGDMEGFKCVAENSNEFAYRMATKI